MKKLLFTKAKPSSMLLNKRKLVLSFLNMYSLYLFKKEPLFTASISNDFNINFPDGKPLSWKLKIPQIRGPTFTRYFLTSNLAKNKKHFFIGNLNQEEFSIKVKIIKKNIASYNPPYISDLKFSEEEIINIASKLKKFKPDYVWVCIGNPKQEILSASLYKLFPCVYFNVGAALDFLLEKKKEAPKFWRNLGLEWFYRGITDFKYSKKKIWRSFLALGYLYLVGIKK